jgi:hypothetical protein
MISRTFSLLWEKNEHETYVATLTYRGAIALKKLMMDDGWEFEPAVSAVVSIIPDCAIFLKKASLDEAKGEAQARAGL